MAPSVQQCVNTEETDALEILPAYTTQGKGIGFFPYLLQRRGAERHQTHVCFLGSAGEPADPGFLLDSFMPKPENRIHYN